MRGAAVAIVLAFWAGAALAADPVDGTWKTLPDDNGNFGYVVFAPCGGRLCGTLTKSFDSKGAPMESPNIGRKIVWDMLDRGKGHYHSGKIWAPDRDKTYASVMDLKGDTLSVAGCILGGLICRSQKWTRVK